MSGWVGGFAEWDDGDVTYLSVAFTWLIPKAHTRALIARALGKRVIAGGPALFQPSMKRELEDVAEIAAHYPDAVARHNPDATIASRGCPGRGTEENPDPCSFCIVPKMEGTRFTLVPDFPVRPILCDNNLSALPEDYQRFIIDKYQHHAMPLLDANSGFEPATFSLGTYERWRKILRGPWRFVYDEIGEGEDVRRVMRILEDEPAKRKRVYVLIGNEPFAECMARIDRVIAWGGEPHVQPLMKLVALEKEPHVRHDWTAERLKAVARWANRRIWRYAPFSAYDGRIKTRETYDAQQGLFV